MFKNMGFTAGSVITPATKSLTYHQTEEPCTSSRNAPADGADGQYIDIAAPQDDSLCYANPCPSGYITPHALTFQCPAPDLSDFNPNPSMDWETMFANTEIAFDNTSYPSPHTGYSPQPDPYPIQQTDNPDTHNEIVEGKDDENYFDIDTVMAAYYTGNNKNA